VTPALRTIREKMDELVYDNFAYHHSVIGSMADLDAASVDDVRQFFRTYYAPTTRYWRLRATWMRRTPGRVRKYFGSIPRQEAPKAVDLAEPEKNAERRAKIDDKLARLTQVEIAYRIPEATNPDSRALSV